MTSSTYSPTNFSSNVEVESVIDSIPIKPTPTPSSSNSKAKANKFNNPDYKLELNSTSNVYILKNDLFTYYLILIIKNKPYRVIVQYTI